MNENVRMKHPSHDDLAAYALGAVEGRDERSISKHVAGCERCAAEMRERLAPAVAVLAESVEQVEPPPELRQNLMATVREEAAAAATGEVGARPRSRRSGLRGFLLRPAAGLAAVALVIAGFAGYLIADGPGEEAETVPIANASGDAGGQLVLEDGSATLQMHGMDQLAKGSVYQVWVAGPDGVQPSATFLPHEDGTATAALPEAADDVTAVMVTAEEGPGRTEPTTPPIIDVRLD